MADDIPTYNVEDLPPAQPDTPDPDTIPKTKKKPADGGYDMKALRQAAGLDVQTPDAVAAASGTRQVPASYDPLASKNAAIAEDLRTKEAPALKKESEEDWWKRELNRRVEKENQTAPLYEGKKLGPHGLIVPDSNPNPPYARHVESAEGSMYGDQAQGKLAATTKPGEVTNDPPPAGISGTNNLYQGPQQEQKPNQAANQNVQRQSQQSLQGGSQGGGGGGGSSSSAYRFASTVGNDYDEQIAAMERERDARKGEYETPGARSTMSGVPSTPGEGPIIQGNRALAADDASHAYAQQSRARDSYYEGRDILAEIHKLVDAGAGGKINLSPHIDLSDRLSAVGATLAGHPEVAAHIIDSRIQQSIAAQQEEANNKFRAAGHLENLWELHSRNSKTQEEAYDKTYATLHGVETKLAENALLPYKGKQQEAQADQMIAAMRLQQHEVEQRILASQQRSGGAGTGQAMPYIPIENGAQTVTTSDGQNYYVPKGGDKVTQAVEFSEQASKAARELADFASKPPPNPLTNIGAYTQWVGELRERLKQTSVLGAQHLGAGGRGSVATQQAYSKALGGLNNDPKGLWESVADYPSLVSGGVQKSIAHNAQLFAVAVEDDQHKILQTNGAVPGRAVLAPINGTGEFKGQRLIKQVFEPGNFSTPKPKPEAPNNAKPNTDWRNSFRPGN